jgi:hypothetical protein
MVFVNTYIGLRKIGDNISQKPKVKRMIYGLLVISVANSYKMYRKIYIFKKFAYNKAQFLNLLTV